MLTKKEIEENRRKIIQTLRETKRDGIESLVEWLEKSNFFESPASTMFHGNFEGGLAAHSYQVYKRLESKTREYSLEVSKDSCAIAGICHDFCKVDFYIPNKLKSGNISETKPYKTNDNYPIGHGEKSVVLTQKYIELTPREAVLIRWHMGHEDKAWEDYKDKVESLFPEVVLMQHADKEVSLIEGL